MNINMYGRKLPITNSKSTPLLFQECSVEFYEEGSSNPTNNHSSQVKMILCDAQQWCRSRPVILGFLSSILLHTTAVILVLTDHAHSERKRQIAEVLMNTPLGSAFSFFCLFVSLFLSVLLFSSRLVRRKFLTQDCCFMLLAAANFWATFWVLGWF
jgi:hypothetical protein